MSHISSFLCMSQLSDMVCDGPWSQRVGIQEVRERQTITIAQAQYTSAASHFDFHLLVVGSPTNFSPLSLITNAN